MKNYELQLALSRANGDGKTENMWNWGRWGGGKWLVKEEIFWQFFLNPPFLLKKDHQDSNVINNLFISSPSSIGLFVELDSRFFWCSTARRDVNCVL